MTDALRKTPLMDAHLEAGAKLVPFAGWSMPIHYGSQIAEHRAVRNDAGMFDVSHMMVTDFAGDMREPLCTVLAGKVDELADGHGLYTVMLNEDAGIIDDLIIYRRANGYRLVTNAGTRARVLEWLDQHGLVYKQRSDIAIIAVQGPRAIARFQEVLETNDAQATFDVAAIESFAYAEHGGLMIARTGYTGEDGVEVFAPAAEAPNLWQRLRERGVAPCGLGARDTLRLEAGMNLHGQDMDETTTPLECSLGWTVRRADSGFIGAEAMAAQRQQNPHRVLRGVVLEDKGVLRAGQEIDTDRGRGVVTSGIFSPTLEFSIGMARVPRGAASNCTVTIRDKAKPARFVKPPFVRLGERVFE